MLRKCVICGNMMAGERRKTCSKKCAREYSANHFRNGRVRVTHECEVGEEYLEKAQRLLNDGNYEEKVNEVMAVIAGKRLVGKSLNSPVDLG